MNARKIIGIILIILGLILLVFGIDKIVNLINIQNNQVFLLSLKVQSISLASLWIRVVITSIIGLLALIVGISFLKKGKRQKK